MKIKKTEQRIQEPWNDTRKSNRHKLESQKEKRKRIDRRNSWRTNCWAFSRGNDKHYTTERRSQEQQERETLRNKIQSLSKPPPKHKIIRLLKTKYRENLEAARGKKRHLAHRGRRVRMVVDFLLEITQNRRRSLTILKSWKKSKSFNPGYLKPTQILFKKWKRSKYFPRQTKNENYSTRKVKRSSSGRRNMITRWKL